MDKVVKCIGALLFKCDFQVGMVEAFKGLLVEGDAEENAMLKKFAIIEKAWLVAIENSNKYKYQLVVIGRQVDVM
jgi:hypothetical protein